MPWNQAETHRRWFSIKTHLTLKNFLSGRYLWIITCISDLFLLRTLSDHFARLNGKHTENESRAYIMVLKPSAASVVESQKTFSAV